MDSNDYDRLQMMIGEWTCWLCKQAQTGEPAHVSTSPLSGGFKYCQACWNAQPADPSPLPQPEGQTPRTDAEVFEIYQSQRPELRMAVPVDFARTLERELGEVRAAQWRPIETANNDASIQRIIGIEHNHEPSVYRKVWDGTWREANDPMGSPRCWPILWQPLPTPPSA